MMNEQLSKQQSINRIIQAGTVSCASRNKTISLFNTICLFTGNAREPLKLNKRKTFSAKSCVLENLRQWKLNIYKILVYIFIMALCWVGWRPVAGFCPVRFYPFDRCLKTQRDHGNKGLGDTARFRRQYITFLWTEMFQFYMHVSARVFFFFLVAFAVR